MQNQKMQMTLKIADLYFNIDSYYDAFFEERTKDYVCTSDKIDVNIKIEKEYKKIPEPKGKKLTECLMENWYSVAPGIYECFFYDPNLDVISARIVCNTAKKDVHITLLDVDELYDVEAKCFVFNWVQKAFQFIILFYNGFEVHSSSIVYNNTGIAFSAESGTGKSTHTGLWLKNYPETVLLNDDTPVMRFVDDEWRIYGTPWAGTTGINKNISVPLKALIFLERSSVNTIRDCIGPEAIKRFFEAIVHPVSDETTDLVLNTLSLLIKHSRICVLGCNMEDEAVETVKEFLFG